MTGKEIVKRARDLSAYKYWYGGKGETATVSLADRLKRENPGVWTDLYYSRAMQDIGRKVGDCSFLVCYAYNRNMISSYSIAEKYKEWKSQPKNGMILWRPGHVAIYGDGKCIQLKSQAYDYVETNYKDDSFSKVLYDPNVDYDYIDVPQANADAAIGWHYDGKGWYYRYKTGTGKGTYYAQGVFLCNTKQGAQYYAFDKNGYMIRDINKLYITDYGNLEVK